MEIKLLGSTKKEDIESRIKILASAGKLSRYPGNVLEVMDSCSDFESNLKLVKRIIGMGHKSIIEHDYLVFALCDVTPTMEQIIIESRLTSFTIKSRREVDFRNVGFEVPNFRDKNGNEHKKNKELQQEYTSHMKSLFDSYGNLVDKNIKTEDARFILPYCYHSNIIMGLDARELESLINHLINGRVSLIAEARELGMKFYDICCTSIPYLKDMINVNKYTIEEKITRRNEAKKLLDDMDIKTPDIKILDKVELLKYTPNSDEVIVKAYIMQNTQCSVSEAERIIKEARQKDKDFDKKLIDMIVAQEAQREFEQVTFTFQIPISLAVLTHLTRHRMHSLLVPDFTPMWNLENFLIPDSMKSYEKEVLDIVKKNADLCAKFKAEGVLEEDLVYFYLSGNMVNVITTINGRTMQWISRMRCCNKAQWQIREIARSMVDEVKKVSPLLGRKLGATCETEGKCYEGKECCGRIQEILNNK